jgi:membrane-bound lytic murein transglycosylase MltF
MGNLSLAYRFNPALLKPAGISSLRVGLNAANLFYFSTVKRERGVDYPFARQFTFSLNLNF